MPDLRDTRVLIVEDEFLVALLVEEDLRAVGFSILGPFSSLAPALAAAGRERFDVAVLDINLGGEMVFPLADALAARGVPFIFLSGYGAADLPARFKAAPRLAKPHDPTALIKEIERVVGKPG